VLHFATDLKAVLLKFLEGIWFHRLNYFDSVCSKRTSFDLYRIRI